MSRHQYCFNFLAHDVERCFQFFSIAFRHQHLYSRAFPQELDKLDDMTMPNSCTQYNDYFTTVFFIYGKILRTIKLELNASERVSRSGLKVRNPCTALLVHLPHLFTRLFVVINRTYMYNCYAHYEDCPPSCGCRNQQSA